MGISFIPRSGFGAAVLWAGLCLCARLADASPALVSTDLCADQVVLALADRDDIRGLSRWSSNAAISAVADRTAGIPALPASAEVLIMTGAEIAVVDPFTAPETIRLLKQVGMRIVAVPAADDFPSVLKTIRDTGDTLGKGERADAFATVLEGRLNRLAATRPSDGPVALYLRPDGGTAGSGTAVDAAFQAAGLRNAANDMGYHGWARTDLETLLFHPPELIVASFFEQPATSWQASLGRHPVYRRFLAQTRKIEVPAPLWACGGWPLVDAAERLRDAREARP